VSEREHERVSAAGLHALAVALAGALTPAEVANVTLEHGCAALGASAGALLLLSDAGDALELLDAAGYPAEFVRQRAPLAADAPLADALRSRAPVLVGSREAAAARYAGLATIPRMRQHAWAALPLLLPGRDVGVLELGFEAPRAFSAADRALMEALAQLCAQALDRARRYEAERQARIDAEAAVRRHDELLSVAAHELKTPLTSLLGQAQLLQRRMQRDGVTDARYLQSLDTVVSQAVRLNKMVSAVLDFARIERGQLSIERAMHDLGALVRQAAEEIQPTLASYSLIVDCEDAGALPIAGDAPRLVQVIQSLISNAVKYSPGGGTVLVRTERRGDTALVRVIDRGIGIPASDLPRLGTRFFRAANAGMANISGMGIGLYVAHEIIGLHGGTIEIASEEGAGTTVTVELKLEARG
jgi:signal transduction histidine kinase